MVKLSNFGEQLTNNASIVDLMDDLGQALNVNPDLLFLGGGNPGHIPEFETEIAKQLSDIANTPEALHKLIGIYQSPQGSETLIKLLVDYFNQRFDWGISEKNIAITNGSQSAFFILINMLAGPSKQGHKHFLFPLVPEYLGYSDQALGSEYFVGCLPKIEKIGEDEFKYHIDFDNLNITDLTSAICVSRPTNPSGNVISDDEVQRLNELAQQNNVPLIIDCAYGAPFPNIVYQDVNNIWNENIINVFSLSKLGLPAVRTGIVVANENIINKIVNINTVMSLANGNFGPELMSRIIEQNKLEYLCDKVIKPFYNQKRDYLIAQIRQKMKGINYRFHQAEGAFFLWIWFEGLSVTSTELYNQLKQKGVLVMDGKPFFFATDAIWEHQNQCLRLSYCQSEDVLSQAVDIISETVSSL
ncbi:valine--pyruvate transaminase [Catenovulum maritimum]|uniref:Valine--pyruvate aminotransferase n=1 Tax=Catenovulum maritimum TaxID=1513271 RepID=A0A0J8GZ14_9ALTE|nr:valine--pyruvate transaminase [Catenovulum maritimum]KMT66489.1 valine--pyruvate aminotransferase [Catenovulum maritimum]